MRLLVAVAVLLGAALPAQNRSKNAELHVAFVGTLDSPRGQDFVRFLREQYPRLDAIERKGCTPDKLRFADVVVLDWPQQEGVLEWIQQRGKKAQPRVNPLGDLARWDRPTVLLGSAGLNVAMDWGLPGSSG